MKNLINKYHHKIQHIIKNFTGEYNEDLEQEIYLKTYLNLDKYKEQNKFSQWICTIAANLCRDYLKSSKNKIFKNNVSDDDKLNNIQSNSNPEKEYSLQERQKIVLREINSLPKKMKEVIILYEFEDCSYEKIASKLNVPIGTVKSRINNARTLLKEKLSFLMEED